MSTSQMTYDETVSRILEAKGGQDITSHQVLSDDGDVIGVDLLGNGWEMRMMWRPDGEQSVWFHTGIGNAAEFAAAIVKTMGAIA